MSGYLERVAARAIGAAPLAEPVVPSLFGPWMGQPLPEIANEPEVESELPTSPRHGRAEQQPDTEVAQPQRPDRRPVPIEAPTAELASLAPAPAPTAVPRRPAANAGVPPIPDPVSGPLTIGARSRSRGVSSAVDRLHDSPATAAADREPAAIVARPTEPRTAAHVVATAAFELPTALSARPAPPLPGSVTPTRTVSPRPHSVVPAPEAPRIPVPAVRQRASAPRTMRGVVESGATQTRPEPPTVEISIGRIEIRSAPAPTARSAPGDARPAVTLAAYLRERDRGARA